MSVSCTHEHSADPEQGAHTGVSVVTRLVERLLHQFLALRIVTARQLRLTERYTRTTADTITLEMTAEDPVMFTAPWKVTRRYKRSTAPQESVRGTYCDFGDMQPIKVKP